MTECSLCILCILLCPTDSDFTLDHEEQPHIEKQEPSIKQEGEDELSEFPFTVISVKTEADEDKFSLLSQSPAEQCNEGTSGEDCGGSITGET